MDGWYEYNDEFVMPISPAQVATSSAYILFYRFENWLAYLPIYSLPYSFTP